MQDLIAKAAEQTKKTMAGVQPSQFSDPTPCSEMDVKALTNHIAGLAKGSELAAKKQPRVGSPGEMGDITGDNPGAAYAPLADAAVAAWSQPGALEGNTQFGPGEMPAQMAASITLLEVAVHGWDLAAATGQDYEMDPEVAAATYEVVKQIADGGARERGTFGPEVKVDAGASTQDQLLGLSGRNPNWKP